MQTKSVAHLHRVSWPVVASGLWLRFAIACAGAAMIGVLMAREAGQPLGIAVLLIVGGAAGAAAAAWRSWSLLRDEEQAGEQLSTPALRALQPREV